MVSKEEGPGMLPELHALMERFNQLGRLLPRRDAWDDLDFDNPKVRAEIEVVLGEIRLVKAQINGFLAQHGLPPWFGSATNSSRS